MTKYLHTMIRVSSLEDTIAFFAVLGLREIRRRPDEKGRYTNVFLAAPGDEAAAVELTYNWDPEPYNWRSQFRTSRLCRRQHLRHLQCLHRARRNDQPPATRRPYGLHPDAGQHLHRAAAGWQRAAASRTLDQHGQYRFLVGRKPPTWRHIPND